MDENEPAECDADCTCADCIWLDAPLTPEEEAAILASLDGAGERGMLWSELRTLLEEGWDKQ